MESAFRVNASLFTVVPVPKVLNTFCSIAISALSNLCIASLYSTISCTKPTVDWCPPISRVGAGASAATGAAARLFSSLLPRPNSAPLPPPVQDGCRNTHAHTVVQRWGQIPERFPEFRFSGRNGQCITVCRLGTGLGSFIWHLLPYLLPVHAGRNLLTTRRGTYVLWAVLLLLKIERAGRGSCVSFVVLQCWCARLSLAA
jgi:hypothetical protein